MNALDDYFSALVTAAARATGAPLDGGTTVASDAGRAGARSATSYPTPSGTIVWCDPALVDVVADLLEPVRRRPIESTEFVDLAITRGATLSGFGNNRVLIGDVGEPAPPRDDLTVRRLDRDDPDDVGLLAQFVDAVSDDDRDEADLDLDRLDPFIVGIIADGRVAGYASGLPSEVDERFDDIGVLTHPEYRRIGLGATAVSEFVRRRLADDPTRRMLYRCDIENAGSNALAESLGFTFAHTIGAVRFP